MVSRSLVTGTSLHIKVRRESGSGVALLTMVKVRSVAKIAEQCDVNINSLTHPARIRLRTKPGLAGKHHTRPLLWCPQCMLSTPG
ncbi:hypothetical protein TNCV_5221 [Trichonephila clavipes]|nr:hypothetical protein TNCV_5221 [Trichonephila clavipes]